MGKFINQELIEGVNKTLDGFKERLNNPFYAFNQQKPYTVTYFNINKEHTSFDEASGLNYDSVGEYSSIKYNKINNFIIYGVDKLEVTINTGEIGAEADPLGGNCIILPNTITPYAGDMFILHEDQDLLCKIQDAQSDTLSNGANVWKIEFQIQYVGIDRIECNVIDEYEFVINNTGTEYNPILKKSEYELLEKLDYELSKLRLFYKEVFYSDRVQSLIFLDKNRRFYDSFVTEFVIRTKLLRENSNKFTYLSHQVAVPKTFSLDYEKSFFRRVEEKDKRNIEKTPIFAYGIPIESSTNIFSTRYEEYYELIHDNINGLAPDLTYFLTFETFDQELLEGIRDNKLVEDPLSNIIIKYFNDININSNDIDTLKDIDYKDNYELFFKLPIIIYIVEYYCKKLMSKESSLTKN